LSNCKKTKTHQKRGELFLFSINERAAHAPQAAPGLPLAAVRAHQPSREQTSRKKRAFEQKIYIWGVIMTFDEYCEVLINEANSPAYNIYIKNVHDCGKFQNSKQIDFEYEFEYLPYYNELIEKLKLNKVAGKGNSFERILNLMQWLTDNTHYCGYSSLSGPRLPEEILTYSFCKGFDGAINCANKAALLADLLMAVGIFALPVWIENFVLDK
jgi:transglutaminase-like putative cysteine protease